MFVSIELYPVLVVLASSSGFNLFHDAHFLFQVVSRCLHCNLQIKAFNMLLSCVTAESNTIVQLYADLLNGQT